MEHDLPTTLNFVVRDDLAGQRLDRALASVMGVSRTRAQEAIKSGAAQVNGRAARASQIVEVGQRITLAPEASDATGPSPNATPVADAIPLRIVYEDAHLLVVDKPAGMVTHPAPGHSGGTLVNALLAYAPQLGGVGDRARPGIVHRLDKDTSGLLVVAKDAATHAALAQQMKDRAMVKRARAFAPWKNMAGARCWRCNWRPDARIRFASIWPPSTILSSAILSMVAASDRSPHGSSSMPAISNSGIRLPASGWPSMRPCPTISRRSWLRGGRKRIDFFGARTYSHRSGIPPPSVDPLRQTASSNRRTGASRLMRPTDASRRLGREFVAWKGTI